MVHLKHRHGLTSDITDVNVCTRRTDNPKYDFGEDGRKRDDGNECRASVDSDAVNAVNMARSCGL